MQSINDWIRRVFTPKPSQQATDEAEHRLNRLLDKSDELRDAMSRYGITEDEMRENVRKNAEKKP
jgi:hypothetical protein